MTPSRSASIFLIPFLAGTGSILLYHQASESHLNARDVASRQIRPAAIPKDGTHDTYLPSTCIPASKEDAQRMLAEIRSLRDQGGWRELALANVLVAGVASREPELVLGFLLERESAPLRRSCLPTLLNVWVACDPSGAVDKIHACEMTEPDRREIDFRLLGALAEQAPERALKVLEHNNSGAFTGDSFNMVSLYFQAFFSWAIRDPDEAAAQLDGIKDPAQRKNALRGIAIAHARGNFHEALDWCSQSHLDEGSRSEILQMIYLEGFRRDGQAAMAELTSCMGRADGQEGLMLFERNLPSIIELDPHAALALLMRQSANAGFTEALDRFMKSVASHQAQRRTRYHRRLFAGPAAGSAGQSGPQIHSGGILVSPGQGGLRSHL